MNYFYSSKDFKESVENFGKKYHRNKWDNLSESEKNITWINLVNIF
ncbi:hypothetical protein XBKQ1_1510001 [Xenorhabdus bovienii str. kraussei Quebec]|uniref:Uncharacterized protein n=1 Tax=Xenorhabdus bovienii str. kraussei Quebec TaxID=1398203 RepID=A0A077PCI2_XENBV|nr:hypothetical protein XBKQ1_1510001 [Xenorhabdus bovienii str. kraussei Quebec]